MPLPDTTDVARRPGTPRHRRWLVLAAVVALAVTAAASGADADADTGGRRRITALRVTGPIVVDGHLDEGPWHEAEPAGHFVQQQPHEGQPSSQSSEVRFLYDDATLYVGGTLRDERPDGTPMVESLTRDFTSRDGDVVAIVLDTFLDSRNAFTFATNPAGPRATPRRTTTAAS